MGMWKICGICFVSTRVRTLYGLHIQPFVFFKHITACTFKCIDVHTCELLSTVVSGSVQPLGYIDARCPDQRTGLGTNPGLCEKLGQVNSDTCAIGLISWAANFHQAV